VPYKDPEMRLAYQRVWRETHRADRSAYAYIWREAHREEYSAYMHIWREAHRVAPKEKGMSVYLSAEEQRERGNAYSRTWRAAHREEARIATRAWRKAHPKEKAEQDRRRKALKRGATIGPIDLEAIKVRDRMLCCICGKRVAERDLSFDHTIPLILHGPHSQENLRVAHLRCNLKRNIGYLPVQMVLC